MSANMKIKLLEPKARGLMLELEELGLIEILHESNAELKAKYLEKLQGKNLLRLDPTKLNLDE